MTKEMEKEKVPSSPQSFLASPAFRIARPGQRLQQGSFSLRGGGSGQDIQIQECRGNWLMRPLSNTFEGDGADIYFLSVPWSGL